MNLEEKLYTSTEVAQILGVSLRSVYRYLDEGKLDAEVKTATGRHRFTKKNILDFLYPNGEKPADMPRVSTSTANIDRTFAEPVRTSSRIRQDDVPTRFDAPVDPQSSRIRAEETPLENKGRFEIEDKFGAQNTATAEIETEESEPIDWLAKFREAAKKFREEEEKQQELEPEPAPIPTPAPAPQRAHVETFTSLGSETPVRQREPEVSPKPKAEKEFFYYRSMIGGLKDIAQNIDKNARKSNLNYAFTRSAGLSLHKPIRPFSLLHAYVTADDKEFFERALHLVPSDENNAQLCLISTDNRAVFNAKKEMHNLFVVSDSQLRKDLSEAGDDDLVVELDSVLGF